MNSDAFALSRRGFVKSLATAGLVLPTLSLFAQPSAAPRRFKVGLIGCGGRGRGALTNILEAAPIAGAEVEIYAVADVFEDNVKRAAKQFQLAPERCFTGFSSYQRVLEQPIDIVFLVTPPSFRPLHFEAAVEAGKHCFLEKPVAVDPPGCRRMFAAGQKARERGLAVVAGAQRRHMGAYLRNHHAIQNGAIGRITGGSVMWNQGRLWYKERLPGENDANYLARNWVNFLELSGDHIVEQHFHNLDVANWYIGRTPRTALGFGGRSRRKTGNQYDFFSVDFDYGQGCHIHSSCRQIDGCYDRVGEQFTGTEGTAFGGGKIERFDEKNVELREFATHANGMIQEHVDLLTSIISGQPLNDTQYVTESTLTAIMGRISAYTGQMVRWSDLTTPEGAFYDLKLSPTPEDFERGNVVAPAEEVAPIPGAEKRSA